MIPAKPGHAVGKNNSNMPVRSGFEGDLHLDFEGDLHLDFEGDLHLDFEAEGGKLLLVWYTEA